MKHPSVPDPETSQWNAESDRRSVYPGTIIDSSSPLLSRPRNAPISRRRMLNPSTIMMALIGVAVAIVLYISNIIAVNQLLLEINALETEHRQILMEQERLKAQMNRMASLERIQERAEAELGLTSLREPPVWIEVDQNLIHELEQRARH